MKRIALALSMTLAAVPVVAGAAPVVRPAPITTVTVEMADRGFHPQVIRLKAGQTYRLRFVNRDKTTHDFFAPGLLNGSQITRQEGWKLRDGRLNVPPHGSNSLILTPMRPAPYDAKSSKAIDVVSNMTAQVLVY
ncbi:cupredoxin domain-containing protein [Sphingomonas abietis]|uniref:Cupredoxin domain-containing protein n=1 Tax=Sphingomonas abietis TaxID=3012344 RepID=A0ABY7NN62_9SPHN|nr:cupredoxin domain-containing protein [Sphingomonas abietis]WBO22960.1 cupredoxin domain-containing protein [Sphingomonas abietis]